MVWPRHQELVDMINQNKEQTTINTQDIDQLKQYRDKCDLAHEQHAAHRKRSDDAMNNLTDSNMLLAKSITDMNVTITKVVGIIERDAPDIEAVNDARRWFKVSMWIFGLIVAIAAGWATIKGAL